MYFMEGEVNQITNMLSNIIISLSKENNINLL